MVSACPEREVSMPAETAAFAPLSTAPPPLRDQVVRDLRQSIIGGRFAPGNKLVEREMCDLLGVSRTLVREALRQLEAEGWVRIIPNRGPFVASLTPNEVLEFY